MDEDKQRQMLILFHEFREETGHIDVETKRNTDNIELFEAILREAYGDITLVVAGHHIMFMREGQSVPGEISSADTLIFDDGIAKRIWKDKWQDRLRQLAVEPVSTRDELLKTLYFSRN